MAFMPAENQLDDTWRNKVSPNLLVQADAGEQLDFLVILNEQQDVSAAKRLKTKTARSEYVYDGCCLIRKVQ